MTGILVNYNFTPTWLLDSGLDYHIYDRSDSKDYLKDFPQERITYTANVGNVDADKLLFLIENYDHLPDIFLWGKSNLFKYITTEEFSTLDKTVFQPLLTQYHPERKGEKEIVSFYKDGMYYEGASVHTYGSWIGQRTWQEWAAFFHLPEVSYIPFPPGGNYILTKERVHRYPRALYEIMRATLMYNQLPGEAHLCERSYYLLWR